MAGEGKQHKEEIDMRLNGHVSVEGQDMLISATDWLMRETRTVNSQWILHGFSTLSFGTVGII